MHKKCFLISLIVVLLLVFVSPPIIAQESRHELYGGIGIPGFTPKEGHHGDEGNAGGNSRTTTIVKAALIPIVGYQYQWHFLDGFSLQSGLCFTQYEERYDIIGSDFFILHYHTDIYGQIYYQSASFDLDVDLVGKIPGKFGPRIEIGFQYPIYSFLNSTSASFIKKRIHSVDNRYLERDSIVFSQKIVNHREGSPFLVNLAVGYDFMISKNISAGISLYGSIAGSKKLQFDDSFILTGIDLLPTGVTLSINYRRKK